MSLREAAQMALEWMRDEGIEWIGKGDEVKQALRAALAEADPWKAAVHDALVILFELNEKNADDPRQAVADLVAAEVRIALDPAVSSEAQALIYRGEGRKERLRLALHEICEEWAGAECGVPKTAQEAYAIELAKRMYRLAADALSEAPKAESAGAEPVAWTTDYEIEGLRDGFVQQLTGRSVRLEPSFPAHQVKYLFTHPPAREAESVVNQQLTTELSDEELLAILKSVDPLTVRLPPGIAAFARAVLAARRKG